jgi:hypothetical protein
MDKVGWEQLRRLGREQQGNIVVCVVILIIIIVCVVILIILVDALFNKPSKL